MSTSDAADVDRASIERTTAELLAAVNASDADRCSAVWAVRGVLMPPHHPAVPGHQAIVQYFRTLFSRRKFSFTFTSSQIHLVGDTALERVTYRAIIWPGDDAPPIEDVGKGLHVYERQPNGSWKLTHDIWNSDQPVPS
jgi:ketosteroid isomerase-like protein